MALTELFGSEKAFRISILANNYFDNKALAELGLVVLRLFQTAREIKVEIADSEGIVLSVKAPEKLMELMLGSLKPCYLEIEVDVEGV
ncbi:MAG: hypothetical protein QXR62_06205 [Candidatus Bathyarchaeia archaeon]